MIEIFLTALLYLTKFKSEYLMIALNNSQYSYFIWGVCVTLLALYERQLKIKLLKLEIKVKEKQERGK